jgi:FkbM family methyltransferase
MFKSALKKFIEKVTGVHIFRNTLPRGCNITEDIINFSNYYKIEIHSIFDIGANIGQTILEFKELFPSAQLYCFEPIRSTYDKLKKNVSHINNINTYNMGCGSSNKSLKVQEALRSDLFSLVQKDYENKSKKHSNINLISLDNFTRNKNIKKISILKIDTEGYDLEVLKGAQNLLKQQNIEFIQVETKISGNCNRFVQANEFVNFLDKYDYDLIGIYDQYGWHRFSPLLFCNALFMKRRNWDA